MGADTKIAWTDHTFNPWRGCVKVSPGCTHCYAETLSKRNPAILGVWGPNGTRVVASDRTWGDPKLWDSWCKRDGKRRRVFCASLADVFEDWHGPMVDSDGSPRVVVLPDRLEPATMGNVRGNLFGLIERTPNLDWLLLTKRIENARRMVPEPWRAKYPANVWQGTTVDDQAHVQARCVDLNKIPARVRFLSMEPLLEAVDVADYLATPCDYCVECVPGFEKKWCPYCEGTGTMPGINWVIVGGESGHGARPFDLAWARSIRDQCRAAGIPFFMKQVGSNAFDNGAPFKTGHPKGEDPAEWTEDLRIQEFPAAA